MGLWSFLRSLWRRRKQPAPERTAPVEPPPCEPVVQEAVPVPTPAKRGEAPVAPSSPALEEPTDEDEGWDEGWDEEEEDLEAPDPFISASTAQIDPPDADLEQRRSEARAEALAGEHRIYLSMPAGPGSLAEALNQLSTEGMVEAEFVDDGQGEPHILYRPS